MFLGARWSSRTWQPTSGYATNKTKKMKQKQNKQKKNTLYFLYLLRTISRSSTNKGASPLFWSPPHPCWNFNGIYVVHSWYYLMSIAVQSYQKYSYYFWCVQQMCYLQGSKVIGKLDLLVSPGSDLSLHKHELFLWSFISNCLTSFWI